MSIYIGGSCVGWGSTTIDTTVNEIRFVRDGRHTPIEWNTVDMSLKNNIKMIVNIDSYREPLPRGWDSEQDLRNFTESVLVEIERRAVLYGVSISWLRDKTLFILDNEANEIYPDPADYIKWLKIFKSQIAGRYKIGAGGFTFNKYYYGYLCQYGKDLFTVLCIHFQDGFETEGEIENNGNWYRNLATKYGIKRITCTEAVPSSFEIDRDYDLIISQLDKAIKIGCEDFCVIFIKSEREEINNRLVFVKSTKWEHFKQIIKYYKPKEIIISEDDMKLKVLQIGSKGNQVKWLQQILEQEYEFENTGGYDGIFGNLTDTQVKEYQSANRELVDGRVGKDTTTALILNSGIHFSPEYWKTKLQVYMAYE